MIHKDHALEAVGAAASMYQYTKEQLEDERKHLRKAVVTAVKAKATHEEVAKATGLSRQRITQIYHDNRN